MKIEDIIKAGKFSEPKEVNTKFGTKLVRTSVPTNNLSELYKKYKDEMKSLGFSYSKNNYSKWVCNLWSDLSSKDKEGRIKSVEQSTKSTTDFKALVPDNLVLYPFQHAGVEYMLNRKNILLADDMGLGKTVQAIAYINQHDLKKIIIVCPKSLVLNWKIEMLKWLVNKQLGISIANGVVDSNANIIICNYEQLKKWESEIITNKTYDLCIMDEAHNIKNKKTQKSIYAKSIKADRNIRITGTPICNRPIELFNIVCDLDSRFSNFYSFANRYCDAKQTKYGMDYSGSSNLEELQIKLRESIMVRRLKSDVLKELPNKTRQIITIKSSDSNVKNEQKYINKITKAKDELILKVQLAKISECKEDYNKAVANLKEFNKAYFTEIAKLRHETALAKVEDVVSTISEQLEEDSNKKVIIACHHQDVIEKYLDQLKQYNPVSIVGSSKTEDRQQNVEKFQNDTTCRVFVASILAAGVGITLTASDWVVFAELDWVPANMMQMEDRAHRIGQKQSVLIQHIVLEDSIDAKLAKTLIAKQEIIEKALDTKIENIEVETTEDIQIEEKGVIEKTTIEEIESKVATKEYTDNEITDLLNKLRIISNNDLDNATEKNNIGFNKFDSIIGNSLANQITLSQKQTVIAEKLVKKYHKQIKI